MKVKTERFNQWLCLSSFPRESQYMILDPFWSTSLGVPVAYHCFFYRLVIGRVRSRDYLLNGKRQTAVSTSAPNSLNVSAWK